MYFLHFYVEKLIVTASEFLVGGEMKMFVGKHSYCASGGRISGRHGITIPWNV